MDADVDGEVNDDVDGEVNGDVDREVNGDVDGEVMVTSGGSTSKTNSKSKLADAALPPRSLTCAATVCTPSASAGDTQLADAGPTVQPAVRSMPSTRIDRLERSTPVPASE